MNRAWLVLVGHHTLMAHTTRFQLPTLVPERRTVVAGAGSSLELT